MPDHALKPSALDWDDLRFFLAVSRHRTIPAAAKRLGVTQSTVSRRLASFQERLGVLLLHRTGEGYLPTSAGESIRSHVERVEVEALAIERAIAGLDTRSEGLVRVACSQLLTSHLLTPSYAALQATHRGLIVEAAPEADYASPGTGDADIVVRLRQFDQSDLVVRNVGTIAFGLYGSPGYFARHGEPDVSDGLAGHRVIAQADDHASPVHAAWLTDHAGQANICLRTDSLETQHWAALCDTGLALLPRFRADTDPGLRRTDVATPVPSADIWLGAHRESRKVARVRIVLDCIAATLRNRAHVLNPGGNSEKTGKRRARLSQDYNAEPAETVPMASGGLGDSDPPTVQHVGAWYPEPSLMPVDLAQAHPFRA